MHISDPTGALHRSQQSYTNRTILYAIGTICAMLFLFGAVMVAQTPKHVFLGQKIPVRTMPKPVVVKLGQPIQH
jgi:hypothetical protein